MDRTLGDQLRELGQRGILTLPAELGGILDLLCDMDVCYCPFGRGYFDPKLHPPTSWNPSADHHPVLKKDGGQLVLGNVRLAHIRCNRLAFDDDPGHDKLRKKEAAALERWHIDHPEESGRSAEARAAAQAQWEARRAAAQVDEKREALRSAAELPRYEAQEGGMQSLATAHLLSAYRGILRELKNRGVIRTTNAPTGDYAEFLIARLLGVELAPNSSKSWDVRAPDGKTLQVKSRVITNPRALGERQLSPFRSFAFDEVAIVLFDDDYWLWRAVRIPVAVAQERSTFRSHVNGHVLFAKDQLLEDPQAIDITDELRAVAGEL